jgi:asparagine synthase (glutamine-hydrolysing)
LRHRTGFFTAIDLPQFSFAAKISGGEFQCIGQAQEAMPDGSVVAWQGELFPSCKNWPERIYGLYRQHGADFPTVLDGSFGILIWDAVQRMPVIVRDRVGIVPLFLHEREGRLLVSDRMDGLLTLGLMPEIDWKAVLDFFSFFWTLGDKTFLRGVRRFPAGTMRVGETERTYWDYQQTGGEADPDVLEVQLRGAAEDAVHKQSENRNILGCHVSGGVDSSVIVKLVASGFQGTLRTLSLRFPGAKDETFWIERVLKEVTSEHLWVQPGVDEVSESIREVVGIIGEPMCYPSVLSRYFLEKAANAEVTFNGRGVDELFSGYPWHLPPNLENHMRRRQVFPRKAIRSLFPALAADPYDPEAAYMETYEEHPEYGPLEKTLHVDYRTLLRSWLEVEYSLSMAFGHRALMPFLDRAVVEIAARTSPALKATEKETKIIFKRAFSSMLPTDILNRPKIGLHLPFGEVIREDGSRIIREWLNDDALLGAAGLDPEYVRGKWEAHCRNEINWGWQFWAILSFVHWKDLFGATP